MKKRKNTRVALTVHFFFIQNTESKLFKLKGERHRKRITKQIKMKEEETKSLGKYEIKIDKIKIACIFLKSICACA